MKEIYPELEDDRIMGPPGTMDGAFLIKCGSAHLRVISGVGLGWDHVSVSLPTRLPTWSEMCHVKRKFFKDDETVMQLHPPESDYVNIHPNCLHLWRPHDQEIPLPDKSMV